MIKFKFLGVRIEVSFLFICLVTFILTIDRYLELFWCVLFAIIHEFFHLFFMILFKNFPKLIRIQISGITIVVNREVEYFKQFIILISGCFGNLILALICFLLHFSFGFLINLCLAFFNLLPHEKLDGGQLLELFLQNKVKISLLMKILNFCSKISIMITFFIAIFFVLNYGNFFILIFLTILLF